MSITYKTTLTENGIQKFANIILNNRLHFKSGGSGIRDGCSSIVYRSKIRGICIAYDGDIPIGCALVYHGYLKSAYEMQTYVEDDYRRKGVGTQLVRKIKYRFPAVKKYEYYNVGEQRKKFFEKALGMKADK